ncbi:hypothetical protein FB561_1070 [Kribbella amoyensis]|uniref:Uncharacterized protein n=1 Tax=Kribbella amoyensis TaxID=996641 RepID=A0A561BMA0_9ACTN|nr:hypothetical protein [Kribbella amoyensis]TWD80004.1 hypothetical protein FB561_1070 [Kribbella amoyensis]
MAQVSDRLERRIRADFSPDQAPRVLARLADIPEKLAQGASQNPERMQAALVLPAKGDFTAFRRQLELAELDWRDALMNSHFAHADWPDRLDAALGVA